MAISNQQASDLVRRMRAGDEVAMALVSQTFQDAKTPAGVDARKSMKKIFTFIKKNPVSVDTPSFTGDEPIGNTAIQTLGQLKSVTDKNHCLMGPDHDLTRLNCACELLCQLAELKDPKAEPLAVIILAQGLPLSSARLTGVMEGCPDPQAFGLALCDGGESATTSDNPIVHAGTMLGRARALQLASLPGQDLSRWCPVMAAEMSP